MTVLLSVISVPGSFHANSSRASEVNVVDFLEKNECLNFFFFLSFAFTAKFQHL